MKRVNQILFHHKYQHALEQIKIWERNRAFCRHTLEHFLDVARLAYIHCLEQKMDVKKDVIYAAALLHDIGRHEQYDKDIPHEVASARLADEILPECSFSEDERLQIRQAILGHRGSKENKESKKDGACDLKRLLYQADKASRNCFACAAREDCHWPHDKMNMEIRD